MNSAAVELGFRMTRHIWSNRLRGRKRFPIVTMLEPLETCNLTCKGCGRIVEYRESVIMQKKMLSVEECLRVVQEADTPVVSIAGGEPLIHPQIDEIVKGILAMGKFVFLCTNGLLMERGMQRIAPDRHFCWVVHLDGMAGLHDHWVERKGTWDKAMRALESALEKGYRVCTNTTIFKGSDIDDLHQLFDHLTGLGVEGMMVSAGYPYNSIPERDIFLERRESKQAFRQALDPTRGFNFYNNPLYLEFLRGDREYSCTAWTNPTYTPLGWRKPCYLIADEHIQTLDGLMEPSLWENFGPGKDDRCATCTMHSGYEAGIIQDAFTTPGGLLSLVGSYVRKGLAGRTRRQAPQPVGEVYNPGD